MVQGLWERIRQPKHTMPVLNQIFEEYKALVTEFKADSEDYVKALKHTHEEFPDLSRLIGKGHDAILKGRLMDAIGALKKKVTELEAPPADESSAPTADAEKTASDQEAEKPKFRNMPSLGMD